MKKEIWKPIHGYDGYEASSLGRVRSFKIQGRTKRRAIIPKIMAAYQEPSGYVSYALRSPGKTKSLRSHSAVCLAFYGPPKPGEEVRHLNGIKNDNRITNLKWGTSKQNKEDTLIHGKRLRGEKCPSAKLSQKDVLFIRKLFENKKITMTSMAKKFDVSISQISNIVFKKQWKHL